MTDTAIIILAAGSASRFGHAKQLLVFNNKTLVQHVVDEAISSGTSDIVLVTGAYAAEIRGTIHENKVTVIFNEAWQQGMASGIVAGIKKSLSLNKNVQQVIIAVCDQPYVSASLFQQLYGSSSNDLQSIVACKYADTLGTPVLFPKKYFTQLMSLQGDEGAKKILQVNQQSITIIDFPQGSIDIDTEADYKKLLDQGKDKS